MRVVRACFPLGSDSRERIDKCMHCSPCLQLLGYFNLIAAFRVDFALMKLWLGCPIFTWLAPCPHYSKYWQYLSRTTLGTSVPLSDLGEGEGKEKKKIHVESTLADGWMAHLAGHPGNSRDLQWGMQIWPQIFSYKSWPCFISVASMGRHKHTLILPSLLNQDSSAYSNSPSKYKRREQHVVYIIITAMGLALTAYLIREKHTELIHEFASLYYWSYKAQIVSLVPIFLSLPMFYLWKFFITFSK